MITEGFLVLRQVDSQSVNINLSSMLQVFAPFKHLQIQEIHQRLKP